MPMAALRLRSLEALYAILRASFSLTLSEYHLVGLGA